MVQLLLNLDRNILLWIQDTLRTPVLTPFFTFITSLGNAGMIWIAASIILLIPRKTRKIGIMSVMALLGSLLINNIILKNLVARVRPYEVIPNLQLLVSRATDFSFPSGHSGSSFAAGFVMFREFPKKIGVPILVFAALIAFSRLYVGIHYPSDVFAGVVIGILIAILARKLYYIWDASSRSEGIKKKLHI